MDQLLTNGYAKTYDGRVWRYRAPDGTLLTTSRYKQMIKDGIIVQGSIIKEPEIEPVEPESDDTPWMPEPKPKASRPSGANSQKANAKELALAFDVNLSIITSILALVTSIPELEMTNEESTNISTAAANIFESSELNKKMGKLIANSGDYSMLGYALYLYIHRVMLSMRERGGYASRPKRAAKEKAANNGAGAGVVTATAGDGGTTNIAIRGAALHSRPAGLRGFTPFTGQ